MSESESNESAMEVTQGVRTRARAAAEASAGSKRRTAAPTEIQLSKRRRFVMSHQISTSPVNSRSSTPRDSPERGRISRCSSNGSLLEGEEEDEEQLRSSSAKRTKNLEDLEVAACILECSRDRRETTPSSNRLDQHGDLESTAERKTGRSAPSADMPLQEEIEEFFAAAEKAEKRRFADKYNYDVDRDAPLDGRYEWVRLKAKQRSTFLMIHARGVQSEAIKGEEMEWKRASLGL